MTPKTCKECNWQFDPASVDVGAPEPAQCKNCDGEEWVRVEEGKAGKVLSCCELESCQETRETDSGLCPVCHEHSDEIACKVCGDTIFVSECCG